jgi:signal transduction histidine kinase
VILDSLPDGRWRGAEVPVSELRERLWRPRMQAVDGGTRWAASDQPFAPEDTLVAYTIHWATRNAALVSYADTARTPYRQSLLLTNLDGLRFTVTLLRPMERLLAPGGMPPSPWPRLVMLGATAVAVIALAGWTAWRALALSRARELFAASVTHELRTPLTGITLFAETLLLDRISSPDGRRRALQTIAGEAQRLSALVENVLTMARRGQAEERLQVRPTSLGDLLRSVEDAFAPMCVTRGLAVRGTVSGPDTATIDPEAARRILVNLVDNALRHAAEATHVTMEAIHDDRGVTLVVADDGIGISARGARFEVMLATGAPA